MATKERRKRFHGIAAGFLILQLLGVLLPQAVSRRHTLGMSREMRKAARRVLSAARSSDSNGAIAGTIESEVQSRLNQGGYPQHQVATCVWDDLPNARPWTRSGYHLVALDHNGHHCNTWFVEENEAAYKTCFDQGTAWVVHRSSDGKARQAMVVQWPRSSTAFGLSDTYFAAVMLGIVQDGRVTPITPSTPAIKLDDLGQQLLSHLEQHPRALLLVPGNALGLSGGLETGLANYASYYSFTAMQPNGTQSYETVQLLFLVLPGFPCGYWPSAGLKMVKAINTAAQDMLNDAEIYSTNQQLADIIEKNAVEILRGWDHAHIHIGVCVWDVRLDPSDIWTHPEAEFVATDIGGRDCRSFKRWDPAEYIEYCFRVGSAWDFLGSNQGKGRRGMVAYWPESLTARNPAKPHPVIAKFGVQTLQQIGLQKLKLPLPRLQQDVLQEFAAAGGSPRAVLMVPEDGLGTSASLLNGLEIAIRYYEGVGKWRKQLGLLLIVLPCVYSNSHPAREQGQSSGQAFSDIFPLRHTIEQAMDEHSHLALENRRLARQIWGKLQTEFNPESPQPLTPQPGSLIFTVFLWDELPAPPYFPEMDDLSRYYFSSSTCNVDGTEPPASCKLIGGAIALQKQIEDATSQLVASKRLVAAFGVVGSIDGSPGRAQAKGNFRGRIAEFLPYVNFYLSLEDGPNPPRIADRGHYVEQLAAALFGDVPPKALLLFLARKEEEFYHCGFADGDAVSVSYSYFMNSGLEFVLHVFVLPG